MHYSLHVITDHKPTESEIIEIMEPYYEETVFNDLEQSLGEHWHYQDVWPLIHWDYFDLLDQKPLKDISPGYCYAILDCTNYDEINTRQRFNGQDWIKQDDKFEAAVCEILKRQKDNYWVSIIDYHN